MPLYWSVFSSGITFLLPEKLLLIFFVVPVRRKGILSAFICMESLYFVFVCFKPLHCLFLKSVFSVFTTLVWQFFLQQWKDDAPLYYWLHHFWGYLYFSYSVHGMLFSLEVFMISFSSLVWSNLTMLCWCNFFMYLMVEIHWASWAYGFIILIKFGKRKSVISSDTFYTHLPFFSFRELRLDDFWLLEPVSTVLFCMFHLIFFYYYVCKINNLFFCNI